MKYKIYSKIIIKCCETNNKRKEYDIKKLGHNLRLLREAKNLSVKDVQEYLSVGSVQAIYKYEEGRSLPSSDNLLAMMELYEASLADLIKDSHII